MHMKYTDGTRKRRKNIKLADIDSGAGVVVFSVSRPHTFVTSGWRRSIAYYIILLRIYAAVAVAVFDLSLSRESTRIIAFPIRKNFMRRDRRKTKFGCGWRFSEWFWGRLASGIVPRGGRRVSESVSPPRSSYFFPQIIYDHDIRSGKTKNFRRLHSKLRPSVPSFVSTAIRLLYLSVTMIFTNADKNHCSYKH